MKFTLITTALMGLALSTYAQVYNNDILTNSGALMSDWSTQFINSTTGSYNALMGTGGGPANFAVFEHRGQSGSGAAAAMVNDGDYDASQYGRDYFLGPNGSAGQQEISGSEMPVFGELFIQNGTAAPFDVTNDNGIGITTLLTFENGITTTLKNNTYEGSIKFFSDATYVGANSDAQHVDGYVSKSSTTEGFVFPVGDGNQLRSLEIAPPDALTEISVAWFTGDPSTVLDPSDGTVHSTASFAAPITSVSTAGYWDWILLRGTYTGAVTVSIPDLSITAPNAADLRLVGWDGSQWIALGTTGASDVTAGSTLSGTMQTGITAIGIGSVGVPLPVSFSKFNVTSKDCGALLTWTTSMEQHTSHFEVERSLDGRSFNGIAQVQAAGNSSQIHHYSYHDMQTLSRETYYRISQVDKDGKRNYTTVKSLYSGCGETGIKVYPTFIKDQLFVDLDSGYEGTELRVYTTLGEEMRLLNTGIASETGRRNISFKGLAPGQYFLRATTGNRTHIFKITYQP